MTDAEIDAKIQKAVQERKVQQKADFGGIWTLVGFLLSAFTMMGLRYALWRKSKELAAVKNKAELEALMAKHNETMAKVEPFIERRKQMEAAAATHEAEAKKLAEESKKAEEVYAEQVKKIQAIKNWEELNKLAGV